MRASGAAATAPLSSGPSVPTTLSESGSPLLFPLFSAWQAAYRSAAPAVTITTRASSSAAGIAEAAAGKVTIGASDSYLSAADIARRPGLTNIPLAVGAVLVVYHIPGVTQPLDLNGTVLARIYAGKITNWDDDAIAALNPAVKLPNLTIVPLHPAAASGPTALFTAYLHDQDPAGWPAARVGDSVRWPQTAGTSTPASSGSAVSGCAVIKGCLTFVDISDRRQVQAAKLGQASLANKAGLYTQATGATMNRALASFVGSTPASGSQPLIDATAPGGYPIINYEYAVVRAKQRPGKVAADLQNFLSWAVTTGGASNYLDPLGFVPLPVNVLAVANTQIKSISG